MDKPAILQAIENLLDSSQIPMKEYKVKLTKENGEIFHDIWPDSTGAIKHMYLFSEIFGSYTQDWYVTFKDNKIHIIVT